MITVTVDDRNLQTHINRLRRHAENAEPAFAEIGEMLLSSIERNFQEEGRYSEPGSWHGGTSAWEPLAPATVRMRAKMGREPNPILQISGRLAASISRQSDASGVTLGTNVAYAAIQHFGGKAGRGRKVTIPARPYLVAQQQDIDDALDIITYHLTQGEQ